MIRQRVGRYTDGIRAELRRTVAEDHTPRETAGSFAIGTFVTMLPTLGAGLLLFVAIAYLFDWVSKIALGATVLVFNPVLKWGVYVGSFALGVLLLGPVDGVALTDASLDAGPEILVRLLVGNVILAVVVTVASFAIVHRFAVAYQTTEAGAIIDEAVEETVDEIVDGD